ncbi:MAG TPA: imidazolonepropionase [candidate division WOR-3 bacterium]|uniref:Imidazolonepropionase n=1 Tax=candidate division WOR-3 bacterium TaxID=2052148 RepID=A0A7V0T5G7_UNCW3|nr:imidazolonepropionase [candidate division WOR-3 bacterium]
MKKEETSTCAGCLGPSTPQPLFLSNVAQLLTLTGPGLGIVEDAGVRIRDSLVAEVGTGLEPGPGERVIDCRGCVVLPGFVDPHTHPVFGGWRHEEFEQRLAGRSYREIAEAGGGILNTVRTTRAASEDELVASGRARLAEMLDWGTTTLEAKSGYGLDTETELRMLRAIHRLAGETPQAVIPTFLGAHSVPPETSRDAYVELVVDEMLPRVAEAGLARFCDVFCENFVFPARESRRILEAAKALGLWPRIHADEIESSGGAEVAAEVGALAASHLLRPSDTGLEAMARAGVAAELLPGTCFFLRETAKPPVARMRELGITIALGTDLNPGSSTLAGQPLTIVLACLLYGLTIVEAIRGVTVNAARGLSIAAGTIEPGRRADIIITDLPDYRHLAYRVGHNPCRVIICGGTVVKEERCA